MNKNQSRAIKHLIHTKGHTVKSWANTWGFRPKALARILKGREECTFGEKAELLMSVGLEPHEHLVISGEKEPLRHFEFSAQAAEAGFALLEMPKHMRVACDEAMVREFTGSNHSELATRWKISVQWVYRCLKAAREKQIAREPS